jgi:peptidoglycan/LPS O-acetylase OafA/YrhL
VTPNALLKRVLVFVGARSYGIYVIHFPAAWLTAHGLNYLIAVDVDKGAYKLLLFPVFFGLAELN